MSSGWYRSLLVGTAGAVLGLAASTASAAKITAVFDKVDPLINVTVWLNNPAGGGDIVKATEQAGYFNWYRSDENTVNNNFGIPPGVGANFKSFCIEMTQNISSHGGPNNEYGNPGPGGYYVYDIKSLKDAPLPNMQDTSPTENPPVGPGGMGSVKADLLKALWGQKYNGSFTAVEAAGFQIAVWEIVYDAGLDVAGGDLKFGADNQNGAANTLAAIAKAAEFLSTLDTSDEGDRSSLVAMSSPTFQDQVIAGTEGGYLAPLPGSAWGGLSLLGGLAVTRLVSKRRA